MERFDIYFHKGSRPHPHPHAPIRWNGVIQPGSGQAGWVGGQPKAPTSGTGSAMTAAQQAAQAAQNQSNTPSPSSGGSRPSPAQAAAAAQAKAGQMAGTTTAIVDRSPTLGGDRMLGGGTTGGGATDPDEETPPEEETPTTPGDNNLLAQMETLLAQFGLATPGLLEFAKEAIAKGWSVTEFTLRLREHPDYLANPLFAANMERAAAGNGFMPEGQVLAWGAEAKRLAQQYGYAFPSDNYLAAGFGSGLSLAEIEHRLLIEQRIQEFGGAVRWVAEEELGWDLSDEDLFEIFSDEHSTSEFDRAFKIAQYRGRPVTLGLGVRSAAEAAAFEMLGVDPEEAFSRYEGLAANADRFARLGSIENLITEGLPENFGSNLSTEENSLLVKGLLFNDPRALAQLQNITAREVARFKTGGGPAANQQGQLVGLLEPSKR